MLDVFDGETLYDGGSLLTLGWELDRGERLRRGERRVSDPTASHERTLRTTLGYQYGLRHDVQLGVALSFVDHRRVGNGFEQSADGLGDVSLLAKWRFYRWDARGEALNVSLIGELSVPTGDDDVRAGGMRLEPELQPGSGSFDPGLGVAATYEPRRWRFNAGAFYRLRGDSDDDGARLGDEFVAEVSVGNRFWLEPYPGPFMRADVDLRYYHEDEARMAGVLPNSGGERATATLRWAFRPQPALDFQASVELPFWQRVDGTQLGEDWAVDVTFGYRF